MPVVFSFACGGEMGGPCVSSVIVLLPQLLHTDLLRVNEINFLHMYLFVLVISFADHCFT